MRIEVASELDHGVTGDIFARKHILGGPGIQFFG